MHRLLLAALAAPLLCAGEARAQSESQPQGGGKPSDKQLQDAVQKEVAKLKDELREEIRAEMQGAQAAAAFLGAPEEKPRLEFLELHGYLRLRDYLYNNVDLRRDADPWGYYLFPRPVINPQEHGTITTANTRFRVEPTLNVSDEVRIRAQVDLLDNLVLGSTPEISQWSPMGFLSTTQVPPQGANSVASAVAMKRVWGEVQTPVGLLSFGRMPDRWGLGILANPGSGIDDDYGDNVDRIQFAIPLGGTPLGALTLIPMFDFVATSLTSAWAPEGSGLGQPFDLEQNADGRAIGIKILRLDADDDLKRKLDRGLSSFNWGLWYSYRSQTFDYPQGYGAPPAGQVGYPGSVRRDASAHVVDLWTRYESPRIHFEAEAVGLVGQIGNVSNVASNPFGPVLLRQFGGTAQGAVKLVGGRLHLGGEVGVASGDRDPGFGNLPGRQPPIDPATGLPMAPVPGIIDGPQYAPGDGVYDVRNFRFNRAYRVDQVLWREILGNVTDAFYVKPTLSFEMLPGVMAKAQLVYSQAIYASSTPSTVHSPLGVEPDVEVSYASDDGFLAWLQYGVLFPLAGLGYIPGTTQPNGTPHTSLTPGHAIRVGLAIRY